jgi:16S rRNA (cytidine1402-2'-O)-methyltransferase
LEILEKGTLYIVATPIGNLEDITFRAARVLKEVDIIAAEDTRHSRKLLTSLGISKQLTSYYDHNKAIKGAYLLEKLESGFSVALISDAGTPCISDPGYQLVRDAVAADISVVPIPGSSAFVAAIAASGLQSDSFVFEGFLPNRQAKRRAKLLTMKNEHRLLVFYESPKRLIATLVDMFEILGDRKVVIARELTKIYEEFVRGFLSETIPQYKNRQIKGEVVILVTPGRALEKAGKASVSDLFNKYFCKENNSLKDTVKKIVEDTGMHRSLVYRQVLIYAGQKKNHSGTD